MALAEDPDDAEAAFERAVRVLNAAGQTSAGLTLKLRRSGYSASAAEAASRRAVALGYVNDVAFAEAVVARRLRQGRGRALIRRELQYKGLDDSVVKDAVGLVAPGLELASAVELAVKLLLRHADVPEPRRRDKVLAALGRRGFPAHLSRQALDEAGLKIEVLT